MAMVKGRNVARRAPRNPVEADGFRRHGSSRFGVPNRAGESFGGTVSAFLWRVKSVDRFALLHEVEPVARLHPEVLRAGAEQAFLPLIALKDCPLLGKNRFQILNLRPQIVPPGCFREVADRQSHQEDEGDETRQHPVEGDPNRALCRGGVCQKQVGHNGLKLNQHLTTVDGVVTQ